MLNYETILSSYDDKLTLMQWLKKVEAALKDASAVSFDVVNLGNATFKFKIVFEDGSEIESDPIVVNQGDSVASAAIVNGDLILTLTNGDTIDAGNMFDGNVNITGTLDVGNDVYINGDVNITGNTSVGGDLPVTGKITGGEIVENMTGYTFSVNPDDTNTETTPIYAGAVKTGNKLTLVYFFELKPINTGYTKQLCNFRVPQAVFDKLYPATIGAPNKLQVGMVYCAKSFDNGVECRYWIDKGNSQNLTFVINTTGTTAGETYYVRYEITFLLSDNLAV